MVTAPPLDGWSVTAGDEPALAALVCQRHLSLLGARTVSPASPAGAGCVSLRADREGAIDCAVPWWPGSDAGAGSGQDAGAGEAAVQAISGLMAVHGRQRGSPRALGLEVCSVAAGVLAVQGILAEGIARRRGLGARRVETSVLHGALTFLRHHLAVATCSEPIPDWLFGTGDAPPFRTADGCRVEVELLRSETWGRFWLRLGADQEAVRRGWLPFLYKHSTAACPLPAALQAALGRHTMASVAAAADASGATVRRLRGYPEVLADPDVWDSAGRLAPPWTIAAAGEAAPGERPRPVAGELPLRGMRVLEATTRVQGPLAGLLLQMLGAEVWRVEPPGGDPGRAFPPFAAGQGAVFLAYNAGKRAVEADYKTRAGHAALRELAAGADVFLHNWPAGRAGELGLDHQDLARSNPGLVFCQAGGWGGGDAAALATDYLVQAHLGLGDGLTGPDEPPEPTRLTLVDVMGGLVACEGILAALHLREGSGRGARVETSLASGALAVEAHVLEALAAGRRPAARRDAVPAGGDTGGVAVRTDLAGLPRDPVVSRALRPGHGGCWLPGPPWRFVA
jgi:CoA:oxalate CoA-transferase